MPVFAAHSSHLRMHIHVDTDTEEMEKERTILVHSTTQHHLFIQNSLHIVSFCCKFFFAIFFVFFWFLLCSMSFWRSCVYLSVFGIWKCTYLFYPRLVSIYGVQMLLLYIRTFCRAKVNICCFIKFAADWTGDRTIHWVLFFLVACSAMIQSINENTNDATTAQKKKQFTNAVIYWQCQLKYIWNKVALVLDIW